MSTENIARNVPAAVELTADEREKIAGPFREDRYELQKLMTPEGRKLQHEAGEASSVVEDLETRLIQAKALRDDLGARRDSDFSYQLYSRRWDENFTAMQAAFRAAERQKAAALASIAA